MFEIGEQPGLLAGAAGAIFAQLIERGAAGLELRLHGRKLLAQRDCLGGQRLSEAEGFSADVGEFLLPGGEGGALRDALLAFG